MLTVYTIWICRYQASHGSLRPFTRWRRKVISAGDLVNADAQHTQSGGRRPRRSEKNPMFKFFFSCPKMWLLFHQRPQKKTKGSLSEMTVKSVPFEGRACMKTRRKESDFEGGVIWGRGHRRFHSVQKVQRPTLIVPSWALCQPLRVEYCEWGTSLVVLWLRIHLPMQETQVQSVVEKWGSHMPGGQ